MLASETKEIADNVNQIDEDKIDADLKHIEIEIYESAKNGNYSLDYEFQSNKSYGEINEFRNRLISNGYEVEIKNNILSIDWSIEK